VKTPKACAYWSDGEHVPEVRMLYNPRRVNGPSAGYEPVKVCRCGEIVTKNANAEDKSPVQY
jgi:hypothetical protein